jgi:hypothetical protein
MNLLHLPLIIGVAHHGLSNIFSELMLWSTHIKLSYCDHMVRAIEWLDSALFYILCPFDIGIYQSLTLYENRNIPELII